MNKSPHLDRDWLYQKYIVEGLSTYDIGKIVKRDPKNVYQKLRDFDIPTRPRGENLKDVDNYMRGGDKPNPFLGKKHTEETRQRLSEKASVPKPWLRGEANWMFNRRGKDCPTFVSGSTPERQREYARGEGKEFLRQILERDNYTCKRCGAGNTGRRSLHVHHVKSWAGNEDLRFDASNVVLLCRSCHEWVHSNKNTSKDWLA